MPASKCTFHAPPGSTITLDQIRRLVGDRLHIVEGSMGLDAPANGESMILGIGIAMGNATPQLTHVADLASPHVDDDGIARMFAQLGLTH